MTRYLVINENTLAYTQEGTDWVGVLAGSVLKGGRNPLDGPFPLGASDKVRNATVQDFADFHIFLSEHYKAGLIMEFKTEQDAFDWMYESVDDSCIDNTRFAYKDDESAIDEYGRIADNGCCGSFDTDVIVNGRDAVIGCNYGH